MDGDYLLRSALFGMLDFAAVVEISRGGNAVLFGFRDALGGLFPTISSRPCKEEKALHLFNSKKPLTDTSTHGAASEFLSTVRYIRLGRL